MFVAPRRPAFVPFALVRIVDWFLERQDRRR